MDIGDLYLDGIEKSCADKGKGYVPQEQVTLLKEAILKARLSNQLGISSESHKETKKKHEYQPKNMGRKTNKQRMEEVEKGLVESGQYPTIKSDLGL